MSPAARAARSDVRARYQDPARRPQYTSRSRIDRLQRQGLTVSAHAWDPDRGDPALRLQGGTASESDQPVSAAWRVCRGELDEALRLATTQHGNQGRTKTVEQRIRAMVGRSLPSLAEAYARIEPVIFSRGDPRRHRRLGAGRKDSLTRTPVVLARGHRCMRAAVRLPYASGQWRRVGGVPH